MRIGDDHPEEEQLYHDVWDEETEVAEFSVWDATSEAIERVAREDQRKNQQA